ncbi:MAG: hypothetical protein JWN85_4483 [Gammaproteobacteria bacterium]|nr:hypothetical protein [Gammaproteobacteria bacterium]
MSVGAAIFVKTPGLSPIKTRLASEVGRELAEEFHLRACRASAQVLRAVGPSVVAYWAIAEESAIVETKWTGFPGIWQGEGGLAERLACIYTLLQERHGAALLLGADTPQITPYALSKVLDLIEHVEGRFVIGPAADGGFWAFAGRRPVAKEIWASVTYSQARTCAELAAALAVGGASHIYTEPLRDVDCLEDMRALQGTLQTLTEPLSEQLALANWIDYSRIFERCCERGGVHMRADGEHPARGG